MSDSSQSSLTVEEVNQVIRQAQTSGTDPGALVLQIFSGLGPSVSVSGDVLSRNALLRLTSLSRPFWLG